MKRILFIVVLLTIIKSVAFSQNPSANNHQEKDSLIIGTWISEEDSKWKMVFTANSTCTWYYENVVTDTFTYKVTKSTPECGEDGLTGTNFSFLSFTNIQTYEKECYGLYGISETHLSMYWLSGSSLKPMVFVRQNK